MAIFSVHLPDKATPDLVAERAVLVSVEMREGAKIGTFYEKVKECLRGFEAQLPGGVGWQMIAVKTGSSPGYLGRQNGQWLYGSALTVICAVD